MVPSITETHRNRLLVNPSIFSQKSICCASFLSPKCAIDINLWILQAQLSKSPKGNDRPVSQLFVPSKNLGISDPITLSVLSIEHVPHVQRVSSPRKAHRFVCWRRGHGCTKTAYGNRAFMGRWKTGSLFWSLQGFLQHIMCFNVFEHGSQCFNVLVLISTQVKFHFEVVDANVCHMKQGFLEAPSSFKCYSCYRPRRVGWAVEIAANDGVERDEGRWDALGVSPNMCGFLVESIRFQWNQSCWNCPWISMDAMTAMMSMMFIACEVACISLASKRLQSFSIRNTLSI